MFLLKQATKPLAMFQVMINLVRDINSVTLKSLCTTRQKCRRATVKAVREQFDSIIYMLPLLSNYENVTVYYQIRSFERFFEPN